MAKCNECDFPFATAGKCPNCGSENPTNAGLWGGGAIVIVVILLYIFGGNSDYTNKDDPSTLNELSTPDTLQLEPTVQADYTEPVTELFEEALPQLLEPQDTVNPSSIGEIKESENNEIKSERIVDALGTLIDTLPLPK
jgi:predicted Zn-ribbon and HTH transcriptional regulator